MYDTALYCMTNRWRLTSAMKSCSRGRSMLGGRLIASFASGTRRAVRPSFFGVVNAFRANEPALLAPPRTIPEWPGAAPSLATTPSNRQRRLGTSSPQTPPDPPSSGASDGIDRCRAGRLGSTLPLAKGSPAFTGAPEPLDTPSKLA
ncbi:hypothetical protein DIPPA_05268 [Diplonema papillatum]|nr:hypothetical protein DIPPA_05268 [Diplonema papillatum]